MTGPTKSAAAKKADKDKADEAPCELCWPDGWPSEDTHAGHCVHGSWSRSGS